MAATSLPESEARSRGKDAHAEALSDNDDLVLSSSTLAALQACCLQICNFGWQGFSVAKAACCPWNLQSLEYHACSVRVAGRWELQEFQAERQRAADAAAASRSISEDWRLSQVRLSCTILDAGSSKKHAVQP